jgi:hypothetical protein
MPQSVLSIGERDARRACEQLGGALQRIIAGTAPHAEPFSRCLALMIAAGPDAPRENAAVAEDLYLKRDRLNDEGRALLAVALQKLNIMPHEKAQLLKEISKPIGKWPPRFVGCRFLAVSRIYRITTIPICIGDTEGSIVGRQLV